LSVLGAVKCLNGLLNGGLDAFSSDTLLLEILHEGRHFF
jgi:hypothetical protein